MVFFYGGIIMKNTLRRRIYIYLHMKFCELTGKKMIKEYTAVYKYKNKIDLDCEGKDNYSYFCSL